MHQNLLTVVTISSSAATLLALAISFLALAKARRMVQRCSSLEVSFQEELAGLSRDLDTASKQSGEYARKIAWLEAKVRAGHVKQEAKVVTETATPANAKANITERRHRVMALARRGQDVQTIARTLGMHHGEVELMISLGQAA